jgi:hypothetical protein
MQRVFTLTMSKVWVAICESLKYSTGHFDEYDLCERIINDVETRLAATNFNADFHSTKDEVIQTNGELCWRDRSGRAASKLSSALRAHAPTSIRRDFKRNGRIGKALASIRGQALNSTEAAASGMTDDPQNITTEAAIGVSDGRVPLSQSSRLPICSQLHIMKDKSCYFCYRTATSLKQNVQRGVSRGNSPYIPVFYSGYLIGFFCGKLHIYIYIYVRS